MFGEVENGTPLGEVRIGTPTTLVFANYKCYMSASEGDSAPNCVHWPSESGPPLLPFKQRRGALHSFLQYND